jgi:transposase
MAVPTPRELELAAQLSLLAKERDAAMEKCAEAEARGLRLEEQINQLVRENRALRHKLDALSLRIFSKKSEQLSPDQMQLLLQEMETPGPALGKEYGPEASSTQPPRPARTPRRSGPRLPENLPVIEEVLVPETVKAAPEQWRRIGEEVSEQIDYEPGGLFRRRLVRPKYVRRGDADAVPVAAALPPTLQERCVAAPGLIAQILVGKYQDHLPLYRQEGIFWSRHQVWLPRQSMARWVELAADWLRPIYDAIGREVFGGNYVQLDETPIRYLAPGHGQTRTGYLWTANQPGGEVFYQWHPSRAGPEERRRQRRARSRPLLNRLYWLLRRVKLSGRILPRSGLGRAVDYALGQWSVLLTYVEHGELEIDNNACERKIRPTAVGKRNWLFIWHAEAGQRSAAMYTVIESCRAHGIDPLAYLRDVLTRLPAATNRQIPELTPAAWAKAAHPQLRAA